MSYIRKLKIYKQKLNKVRETYDKCVKRWKYDSLKWTFDTRKENREWLCSEDRKLSYIQIKSKGRSGFGNGKTASFKTIHPPKWRRVFLMPTSIRTIPASSSTSLAETEREYQESWKIRWRIYKKQGGSMAKLELHLSW